MKTICILGYKFYGYEKEIIEELEKKYKVIFIDYGINIFEFFLIKIFRKRIKAYLINKKIEKQLINIKNIDILFSISGKEITLNNIKFLEKNYNIKLKILYLWDNLERVPNFFEIYEYFDRIYSFDLADSEKYNLKYRPTFYSKRLEKLKKNYGKNLNNINIFFIGIYRKNRLDIVRNLYSNENFIYLYYPRLFYNIFRIIGRKDFQNIQKYINYLPLKREKYNEIFVRSQYILDIPEKNQTGFTQRVLDAIFFEKKIITTQKNISKEKIYNSNNILIIDTYEDIIKNKDFFKKKYKKISKDKIEYYSLTSWLKEILED